MCMVCVYCAHKNFLFVDELFIKQLRELFLVCDVLLIEFYLLFVNCDSNQYT